MQHLPHAAKVDIIAYMGPCCMQGSGRRVMDHSLVTGGYLPADDMIFEVCGQGLVRARDSGHRRRRKILNLYRTICRIMMKGRHFEHVRGSLRLKTVSCVIHSSFYSAGVFFFFLSSCNEPYTLV